MTSAMDLICDDLEAESAELLTLLRLLAPEQFDALTPAEGWSVRDQISHLAFFDETATLAATNPEAFAASAKELMANADADAAGLHRGRAMTPDGVLSWFETVRAQMIAAFRPLDPKARLPWYGPPMAAPSFATARLMETWAHGQDVVDTFGLTRAPTSRLKHVAHIGVRARPFAYMVNKLALPEQPVAVTLRAPDGDLWRWNSEASNDNEVTGDALDFCLVVTQRRNVADTGLVLHGPLAAEWIPFAQAFAGQAGGGRAVGQFPRQPE